MSRGGNLLLNVGPTADGRANVLVCQGQTLRLPANAGDRLYLLAAAVGSGADILVDLPLSGTEGPVDRALDGDSVWFTAWSFLRAGVAAPSEPQTVNTGYFIVIPQGGGSEPLPAWQIRTHMEIRGQARDHRALSEFVRRLLDQAQIADVRVLNTHQQKYGQATVVDFELAVVVNSNLAGA